MSPSFKHMDLGVAISCAYRMVSHNVMLSSYLERGQKKRCHGADICHHEVSTRCSAGYRSGSVRCFACMQETPWGCKWPNHYNFWNNVLVAW